MALLVASLLVVAGCGEEEPPPDAIASVGQAELTRDELIEMMNHAPFGQDSLEVQEQIIEQWITNELLYQEARRRGLRDDPDVERLLRENERTVLINALITNFYDEDVEEPSAAEIQSYYERHREQLALRAPYVHVRYLATADPDGAETVRQMLAEAATPEEADSLWPGLVQTHALDLDGSLDLSDNYYPESQIFSALPPLRDAIQNLQSGEVSPVVPFGDEYHVVQLVRRVPAGTVPDQAWVEDEIRHRLIIQARKQLVARQVQRLRTEALSRNELAVP